MRYRVKLDKRKHKVFYFKYYVEVIKQFDSDSPNNTLFFNLREWAWKTWGPSKELFEWEHDTIYYREDQQSSQNIHWCWVNTGKKQRIYIHGDSELMIYKLRWE